MLMIIVPLIVVPMLALAGVGFITASGEAGKSSERYLQQRENDLRAIAENPAIRDYFNNRFYGLDEEAEVYRQQLARSLVRFSNRSNIIDPIVIKIRYVDAGGREIVKVAGGRLNDDLEAVSEQPFFAAVREAGPEQVFLSSIGPEMMAAMPVYELGASGGPPVFQGAVVLDFIFPLEDFRRTTEVIALTFTVVTGISLAIALFLVINFLRRLTDPIRRLVDAANRIAAGDRSITVDIESQDEVGKLSHSFNAMAGSLSESEAALRRKVAESETLYEIGQEITAQVALDPTLDLIVARARDLLRAELSYVALREADAGDVYVVRAHSGSITEAVAAIRFVPGQGLGGQIVASGAAVMTGDYAAEFSDSPFVEAMSEANFRSVVAVPLTARDQVSGVLFVLSAAPDKFDDQDLVLLGALANQATISIENATLFHEVSSYAEQLEARVEERTRELQEANIELEQTSQHKSEFLANMSHELRTPLNAIIGYTELIEDKIYGEVPEKIAEVIGRVGQSGSHLLGLINDVLDLSKIEAGRVKLSLDEYAMDNVVQTVMTNLQSLAADKELQLSASVPDDLPVARGDEQRIAQALLNLVGNAIKFTEEGEIKLEVRADDGAFLISVSDTGVGIPEADQAKIFDEFQQADASHTRKKGGTGLGLAITRRMIEMHGGRIWVESTPGEGSTFSLSFPVRVDAQVEAA